MKSLLARGLAETAPLWADVRVGYHWVQQVADILRNEAQRVGTAVRRRLGGLLGAMTRYQDAAGTLAPALVHFRKVTQQRFALVALEQSRCHIQHRFVEVGHEQTPGFRP